MVIIKGEERRESIYSLLKKSQEPIKGSELSLRFDVSRQVIVQDIALLRAEGNDIVATPQGYILLGVSLEGIKRVIAVKHTQEQLEDELKSIILLGGRILDVTIEHKIYGEITGRLMLKSFFDLAQFVGKIKETDSKPLSYLTEGVHLHTIEADNEETIDKILDVLKEKKYLLYKESEV